MKATFGAGCFWGVEKAYREMPGVIDVVVGYEGGHFDLPTYKDVCSGTTGHAEVAQVEFDPDIISYRELLKTFWKIHNPTLVNRQGPDIGEQYRSIIFYHDEQQKKEAQKSLEEEQKNYDKPIATQIKPAETFYRAEDYHQGYLEKRYTL
ncbi:MAG: peptide-methionine (S)-S-oxide reductase MsrA [Chlamydiales bacterium]